MNQTKYIQENLIKFSLRKFKGQVSSPVTDNICNGAAIAEPPIWESIAEIDAVPWQVGLGKASRQPIVVANVRKRVPENELHHLGIASVK